MGLDMYLRKKIYVGGNYEHRNVKGEINITVEGKPLNIDLNKVSYIELEAGYWRKANQIHNWFVREVQDGVDNCSEYYVGKEKLEELLRLCLEIKAKCKLVDGVVTNGYTFTKEGVKIPIVEEGKEMENPEIAERLLPTGAGFFFGNTDYNQYYMQDIDSTIEILEEALQDDTSGEYYYQSSW